MPKNVSAIFAIDKMIQLVYVSSACQKMTYEQLERLLVQSRARNLRQQVTGMLIYCEGNFIQVLEGNEKDVKEIYQSITQDERNSGNIVLIEEPISQRNFANWSMGFKSLTPCQLPASQGFSSFVDRNIGFDEFALDKTEVVDLLYSFKASNY